MSTNKGGQIHFSVI